MAASSGEDWKSFIDRMCRLETENAELKASNKEMYEALETVCGACIYVKLAGKKCCEYCVINKALRKARGETDDKN